MDDSETNNLARQVVNAVVTSGNADNMGDSVFKLKLRLGKAAREQARLARLSEDEAKQLEARVSEIASNELINSRTDVETLQQIIGNLEQMPAPEDTDRSERWPRRINVNFS